jgi:antitoxin (DNA-binding transcriptional repressor) of toxin-antitoxin stability system
MPRLSASKAREEFAEAVNRAAYKGERTLLHRRGKDVAAVVPVGDLVLLEQIEDGMDLEAAREAMKEPGTVSWEKVKKELGL